MGKRELAHLNKKSLPPVCKGLGTQRAASMMSDWIQICHHFDFTSTVNADLQGVIKYTLRVVQGLCALAADIINLL